MHNEHLWDPTTHKSRGYQGPDKKLENEGRREHEWGSKLVTVRCHASCWSNKPWGCYIMDKVNERLTAFSAAAQGRLGRLVKYLVSSTRDGRKRGRTVFSQLDPNITTEQESLDRKRHRKTETLFFRNKIETCHCCRANSSFILITWFCWRKAAALRSRSEIWMG
jgi:hypothetical protein